MLVAMRARQIIFKIETTIKEAARWSRRMILASGARCLEFKSFFEYLITRGSSAMCLMCVHTFQFDISVECTEVIVPLVP